MTLLRMVGQECCPRRLNPLYHKAFNLYDIKKLKDIQVQTDEWILTKDEEVNDICDRLISTLFFFCPSSEIHDGVQVGKIFCRLPPKEGSKLIDRILQKADLPLSFVIKYNGETLADINIDNNFPSGHEPCLEVTCRSSVPTTGDLKIDVEMCSLAKHAKLPCLPISRSPYYIRGQLHGLDILSTVRELCCSSHNFDRRLKDHDHAVA